MVSMSAKNKAMASNDSMARPVLIGLALSTITVGLGFLIMRCGDGNEAKTGQNIALVYNSGVGAFDESTQASQFAFSIKRGKYYWTSNLGGYIYYIDSYAQ